MDFAALPVGRPIPDCKTVYEILPGVEIGPKPNTDNCVAYNNSPFVCIIVLLGIWKTKKKKSSKYVD
jgi:hypothetical protein